jgi:hypothetical protein
VKEEETYKHIQRERDAYTHRDIHRTEREREKEREERK